jgi:hypothetical protein
MSRKTIPELELINRLKEELGDIARFEIIGESQEENLRMPIHKISFGSQDPTAPVLGLIGGVHGLERIGSQVTLSLLHSLSQLYQWDETIRHNLQKIRVFFIPIVNPIGILKKRRSNPNGIDIMRNAPIDAEDKVPTFLGGHRISNLLPWYRGDHLEAETAALITHVKKEIEHTPVAVTVDFHSGFGFQDQIWFPYAKTRKPFADLGYFNSFIGLMNKTYPNHFYKIEPQAYLTHGDVWDYLYDWKKGLNQNQSVYLPMCLEMGSWMWVKKNPLQIFTPEGAYNPVKTHRYRRTLRRHNTFFEFLMRALYSPQSWYPLAEDKLEFHRLEGMGKWYGKK